MLLYQYATYVYARILVHFHCLSIQETGDFVGTVVNIFENAANDLLQVRLNTSDGVVDKAENGALETGSSGPLVWIPFVEAIVPDVDLHERVMKITPPKGLLELNVRPDGMSKKEKKQLVRHTPFTKQIIDNSCCFH